MRRMWLAFIPSCRFYPKHLNLEIWSDFIAAPAVSEMSVSNGIIIKISILIIEIAINTSFQSINYIERLQLKCHTIVYLSIFILIMQRFISPSSQYFLQENIFDKLKNMFIYMFFLYYSFHINLNLFQQIFLKLWFLYKMYNFF